MKGEKGGARRCMKNDKDGGRGRNGANSTHGGMRGEEREGVELKLKGGVCARNSHSNAVVHTHHTHVHVCATQTTHVQAHTPL